MRIGRQLATAGGVFLGIVFYASVKTSQALSPAGENPVEIQEAAKMRLLVSLSLIMCLVGITNAMLMSVTERYKEIGTFKCLGATDSFIVKMFFLEALLIGLIASTTGGIVGVAIMAALRTITDGAHTLANFFAVSPMIFGLSVLIGTTMAVVAAIIPAIQAARMPAAAALRVEI